MANNIIKRVWNQGSMTPIEDLQGSAFTNENGGHTFQISGVDSNGEALALSGTVAASFLRPDQTTVGISGSVSGGVASVTLSEECYGIPGRFGLVVFLTSDGKKTAIYSCVGNVARSSTDAVAPGVTADVVDLINEIETAVGTIPASYSALMADIAPTYSSSALYAVGDYAWYEGDLKRCIVPITVGETYTPAHWTSAVVGDDVCALKSAINDIGDELKIGPEVPEPFVKGLVSANGAITSSGNGAISTHIEIGTPIVRLGDNCKAIITFHKSDKTYIGKVGANGDVNKTSGDWKWFTGMFNILDYATQDSAYYRVNLAPTDSTVLTDETFETWAESKMTCDYLIKTKFSHVDATIAQNKTEATTLNTLTNQRLTQFNENQRLEELIESGSLVPFDQYVLVDYIEANAGNNNNVKIDTGIYLGPTLRTELDAEILDTTVDNYMGREAISGKYIRNGIGVATGDSTKFLFAFGDQNLYAGTADTKRHLFFIDVPALKYGYDSNEYEKTAFTYGSQYAEYPIYLFGLYNVSAVKEIVKVYGAKFYNNGTIYAYFVPVKRISDNCAGFYDVIRSAFYTNEGSGTLIAGPSRSANADDTGLPIKKTTITDAYAAHFNSSEPVDGYLFFTDPHIYHKDVTEETQQLLFTSLMKAYASTPTQFILSGGDWLQGGEQDIISGGPTPAQACGQIGYFTGVMKKLFKDYYQMFGNHDGNYKNTSLDRQTVINLMFPEYGKCYYQFKTCGVRYYIFDTTVDLGLSNITDYKKEQLNWFVSQLLENTDDEDIVIGCHIFTNSVSSVADTDLGIQMKYALDAASAYNRRVASYALPWANTTTKDFSGATGTIHYCIAGHTHTDLFGEYAGIPVLITRDALHNHIEPTFDLVSYDKHTDTLYTDRVGYGANRIMHCGQVAVSVSETLTASITGTLTWASLDTTVATVSNGVVSAVASGYALITATNKSGEAEAWVVSVT